MLIYLSNDIGREVIPEEEVAAVNIMLTYFDACKPSSVQRERILNIIEVRRGQEASQGEGRPRKRGGKLGQGV